MRTLEQVLSSGYITTIIEQRVVSIWISECIYRWFNVNHCTIRQDFLILSSQVRYQMV